MELRIFRTFPPFVSALEPSFSRPIDTFDIRRTGSAVYFLFVPFGTAFGDVGERVMRTPLDADNVPVDDDWRRESESKFFTFVVNESRL